MCHRTQGEPGAALAATPGAGPIVSLAASHREAPAMTTDTTGRMKIVIYYAIWATICAAVAGLVIAGLHTWLFSYIPNRSGLLFTVLSDAVTALAIAAGHGAGGLGAGGALGPSGEGPRRARLPG